MTEVQVITCVTDKFISDNPIYINNAWDYREVGEYFTFNFFAAGFAFVTRKNDNKDGNLQFREFEGSRVYFNFRIN